MPAGMRELLAKNLLVVLRDLELCFGNHAIVSASNMRRTARAVPSCCSTAGTWAAPYGPVTEERMREVRERAVRAAQAMYRELGLTESCDEHRNPQLGENLRRGVLKPD